jgi:CheY-like chemotaxis protein
MIGSQIHRGTGVVATPDQISISSSAYATACASVIAWPPMVPFPLAQLLLGRAPMIAQSHTDPPPSASPTILVVEDDAETREFFVLLLTDAGYQVRVAATGQAGLVHLDAGPLHAAVLDLGLPDMDGYTLCRHIRARMPSPFPILIASASLEPSYEKQANAAGATACFRKPFPPEQLLDALAALVDRPLMDERAAAQRP